MKNLLRSSLVRLTLDSLLLMVFFSLLTSFVEATYTFGLLGTDIPPEIVYVFFLLSPILLLLFPRLQDNRAFSLAAGSLGLFTGPSAFPSTPAGECYLQGWAAACS